uniref:FHA domain-containing protein n=1 Tax=Rhipicephalus appendiculatus TaxID=34631 RepID=A0A131Z1Q0_RHIAP
MVWYPKIFAIKKKGATGTELPFPSGRCSIGGDSSCDVHIRGAGPAHCLLIVDMNKQAHVINVSGTKDVLRNDEHVPNEAFLSHGDVITVGSRQFRFEWVSNQKKEGTHTSPSTTGNEKRKGGARESSTSKGDASKESLAAQQANGTPGVSTPTASSFDQSLYKTPCIPPEVFVSPLSTTNSSDAGHRSERPSRSRSAVAHGAARNVQAATRAKRLSWSDGLSYSPSDVSDISSSRKLLRATRKSSLSTNLATPVQGASSTQGCDGSGIAPVAESPGNGQLYDSSDSTPLIDEPRMQALYSRSSLTSMTDSSNEHEHSASLGRLSKGPGKRRRSSQIITEGQSPKLRRQNGCEDVQDTSLANHDDCNGQSVPEKSLRKNSVEDCTAHIKSFATPNAANGILIASTPVASATRKSRMETGSARKSNILLRQAQKNRSAYSTLHPQGSSLASNAASPELSFLSSRSSSRLAFRSFKGKDSAGGLQTSNTLDDTTLGCELLFETPQSSFNLSSTSSKENGIVHDMSDSSPQNDSSCQTSVRASPATQSSLLHTSGRRRSTASTRMSEQNEVQELETVDTSSSRRTSSHSMMDAKSSRTPASKKVDDEVPDSNVPGTPNALNTSRTKHTPASETSDEETRKRCDVATVQSLKVSGTKRTPASKKVKEEETPERKILDTSLPAQVSAGNVDVSRENSFRSGGASTSMNATAGYPEFIGTPTNLNASRSKQTVALKKVNKETIKQDMSGIPKSANVLGTKEGTPTASHVNEKEQGAACMSPFKDKSSNGTFVAMGDPVAYARRARSGRVSASRTPASRKPSGKFPEEEIVKTPEVNKPTQVFDIIDGMDPQQVTGDTTNEQTVANGEAALEESFESRSTRSSRTPISNVIHLDTPEQVAAHRPNSSTASKVKQSPALKKASRGSQKHNSGVDTSVTFNISGPKETVASQEVEDFEQQAVCASPSNHLTSDCSDVAVGKSARTRRSTRMPDALNISSGTSTPVATKEEVVNTPHSKRVSVYKQTPASNKATRRAVEQETMGTPSIKQSHSDITVAFLNESAKTRSVRPSCTPSSKKANTSMLEQDDAGTRGTFNSVKANCTTPVVKGMEEANQDALCMPQSIRTSGAKQTLASKKVQQNDEAADPKSPSDGMHDALEESLRTELPEQDIDSTPKTLSSRAKRTPGSKKVKNAMEPLEKESQSTSPSKHVTAGGTEVAVAEPNKKKQSRNSRTLASKKANAEVQEQAVSTPNTLNISVAEYVPVSNENSLISKASGAQKTPTNREEKATEQRTRGRMSSALATSDSMSVAVDESVRKRSARLSHTISSEKLNADTLEQDIVSTPSSESASRAAHTSVSMDAATTKQNMMETPKPLRAAEMTQTSATTSANKKTPQHKTRGISPSKVVTPDSITATLEGSVRARRGRYSNTPVSKEASAEVLQQDELSPVVPNATMKHTAGSLNTNEETAKQQVVETVKQDVVDSLQSRRASRAKQTPAPSEVNSEKKVPAQETAGSSPSKQIVSEDVTAEKFVGRRSARSSCTAALKRDEEIVGTPSTSFSVDEQVPFVGEQNGVTTEQKAAVSPVKRAKRTPGSARILQEADVSGHETAHKPLANCVSNTNDVAVEEAVRSARGRSSCTLASMKVSVATSESELILEDKQMPSSEKANKAQKQVAVGTPKSSKVSGMKQKQASGKVRKGDDAQHEAVELQSECVASNDADDDTVGSVMKKSARASGTPASKDVHLYAVEPEAVGTTSRSRSKRTVASNKVNENVMESETDTPKLKAGKSRRKPASSSVNDQDKESEQEVGGVLPLEHATSGVTDVAVEQTTIRSARSRRTPAPKCTDQDVLKSENGATSSSSKAKRKPVSKATNERPELDAAMCSNAVGAKETPASEKINKEEETSTEMKNVNVALEDSTRPVRSTRSCRTVASRKVDANVLEQETAEQPQPKKTRPKRTQAPKKVHEEEVPSSSVELLAENVVSSEKEPTQSPVLAQRKRAVKQGKKDQNCEPAETFSSREEPEQEVNDEVVAPPLTTTTRKGRGKRALTSQEDGTETQISTVEDNGGTNKRKRGRLPKQVAPPMDVLEENSTEELSAKVGISSKSARSRRVAISKQELNDEALASDASHTDEAMVRRSKRKAVEETGIVIDPATVEVAPKKTRGRRAKAVESTQVDEKGSAAKASKSGQPEEVAPAKRTRKRV